MSDLDKNMAVKSMVVMRKAFRTIDAKVSETFKEFNLTQLNLESWICLMPRGV